MQAENAWYYLPVRPFCNDKITILHNNKKKQMVKNV